LSSNNCRWEVFDEALGGDAAEGGKDGKQRSAPTSADLPASEIN
jgi:hypothetical protein